MKARALERYATAYYVSKEKKEIASDAMATEIVERKPHISFDEAQEAVEFVSRLRSVLSES